MAARLMESAVDAKLRADLELQLASFPPLLDVNTAHKTGLVTRDMIYRSGVRGGKRICRSPQLPIKRLGRKIVIAKAALIDYIVGLPTESAL